MKKSSGFTLFYKRIVQIGNSVLHPFSWMPVPDFNYQYDETMLK
jgi:hypothetical protein